MLLDLKKIQKIDGDHFQNELCKKVDDVPLLERWSPDDVFCASDTFHVDCPALEKVERGQKGIFYLLGLEFTKLAGVQDVFRVRNVAFIRCIVAE